MSKPFKGFCVLVNKLRKKKSKEMPQSKFRLGWAVNVKRDPENLNKVPTWIPFMDQFRGAAAHITTIIELSDWTWGYITDISFGDKCVFREEWLTEHRGNLMNHDQRDNSIIRSRWESICAEKEDKYQKRR